MVVGMLSLILQLNLHKYLSIILITSFPEILVVLSELLLVVKFSEMEK